MKVQISERLRQGRIDLVLDDKFQVFKSGNVDVSRHSKRIVKPHTELCAVEPESVRADQGAPKAEDTGLRHGIQYLARIPIQCRHTCSTQLGDQTCATTFERLSFVPNRFCFVDTLANLWRVRADIFLQCPVANTLARIPILTLFTHISQEGLARNVRDRLNQVRLQQILIGRVN